MHTVDMEIWICRHRDTEIQRYGYMWKQSELEVKAKLMNQRLPLQSLLNGIAIDDDDDDDDFADYDDGDEDDYDCDDYADDDDGDDDESAP